MRFPKRSDTHKIETASWRLLQEVAPENWIVREVSERDYGIDAYIEIATPNGDVTGNLISAQLKGVEEINWKETGEPIRFTRSPQIKTSTASYWLNLPVPVFLFVADLSTRRVHYVSVKSGIRKQFEKMSSQDTITFKLADELHISSKIGGPMFDWFVARERAHDQFAFHITNLLSNMHAFGDFVSRNQGRDCFMEVDVDRQLQFRALYETTQMAAIFLNENWEIESLSALYALDRSNWKDDFVLLHEHTLSVVLEKLAKVIPDLARKAIKLVSIEQSAYWEGRDPVFHRLCSSGELEWSIEHLEQVLKSA